MGKIIAVNGAPGSGKTTIAVKLAQELFAMTGERVIYLSSDLLVPSLSLLFPTAAKEKLHSLGSVMGKIPLTAVDLLGVLATTKEMDNLGYLGYKAGESSLTYPALTENRVLELLELLRGNCEHLIVDCDRNRSELLSVLACGVAEHVICLYNPDIRSMLYYACAEVPERAIRVLNISQSGLFLPVQEAKAHFGEFDHTIAYSHAVREQLAEGTLTKYAPDLALRASMHALAAQVRRSSTEAKPAAQA